MASELIQAVVILIGFTGGASFLGLKLGNTTRIQNMQIIAIMVIFSAIMMSVIVTVNMMLIEFTNSPLFLTDNATSLKIILFFIILTFLGFASLSIMSFSQSKKDIKENKKLDKHIQDPTSNPP